MSKKEEVLKELKKNEDYLSVKESGNIIVFKRIGANKSVIKTLDVKPDYVINELSGGVDYVFVIEAPFQAFSVISKLLLLKDAGVSLDFKKIIFYIENHELLYTNEERGIVTSEEKVSTKELWRMLEKSAKEASEKLEKEVILKIIE